jgi:hypothetical protein
LSDKANIPGTRYSVVIPPRPRSLAGASTENELQRLASTGVKKLLVICPAFVADCLEGRHPRTAFISRSQRDFKLQLLLNEHPF